MEKEIVNMLANKMRENLKGCYTSNNGADEDKFFTICSETAIKYINNYGFYALMDLHTAYKNASDNDECADILRCFTSDFKMFRQKYGVESLRLYQLKDRANRKASGTPSNASDS